MSARCSSACSTRQVGRVPTRPRTRDDLRSRRDRRAHGRADRQLARGYQGSQGWRGDRGPRRSAESSTPRAPRRWPTSSRTPTANGSPSCSLQDVSGFMVGTDAEHSGIIRAGARFVVGDGHRGRCPSSCSRSTMPRARATTRWRGQGFDPDFIVSWPTGRMGVMEGESAIQAVFGQRRGQARKRARGRRDARGLRA